ncbi:MAG TPA: type II toxin-antitoxin system RelE/ParE family toxin [Candidatus Paceibacterota bacterium]
MKVEFSKSAFRELKKFPKDIQKRVINKIEFYSEQSDPLKLAERMIDVKFGSYRFRIGDYRVIFDIIKGNIFVLKIGNRKDIYK